MLYMHVRGKVIGKWVNIRLEAGKWLAEPDFDMDDPEAAKIAKKVEKGYLKACSVGVNPLVIVEIDGELWATEWEIIETSIVDAGSNANALALMTPRGEMITSDVQNHILNLQAMSEQKKPVTPVTIPAPGEQVVTAPAVAPVEIALAAGLAEGATNELVAIAIKNMAAENTRLKLEAEQREKAEIDAVIDQAVLDGKIKATDKPIWQTMAAANASNVKTVLANMAKPVDLALFAKDGAQAAGAADDEEALAEEYKKLDKADGLVKLQATNPARFNKLYKARFGVDYKA